jgi:hypothetical protein
MKLLYRITADIIWLVHFLVVVLVLFGWLVPNLWYLYMAVLVGTLVSEFLLSYCFLSKWEFDLRKKVNPKLDYDFTYASYYTYRLTQGHLSPRFLGRAGILFTSLSLVINLYFRFLS